MLILILIDIQYSKKAVFSFEKGFNAQNHSSSCFSQLLKKCPPAKLLPPSPAPPHNTTWKTLGLMVSKSDFTSRDLRICLGDRRPNFVILEFGVLFFNKIHSMQG